MEKQTFDEQKDEIIRDLDVLTTFFNFDERNHTFDVRVARIHDIQK